MWYLKNTFNVPYAYYNNVFSDEEIQEIIRIGQSSGLTKGTIKGEHVDPEKETKNYVIRNSDISWLSPSSETEFIFRRLSDIINTLNDEYYQYDLDMIESVQYTEYDSSNQGHYIAHIDTGHSGMIAKRKLSVSLQLSDENEYEGGELILYTNRLDEPCVAPRTKGTMTVFNSMTLHEVKPVTKGNRKALVAWVLGPKFR